jgi:hypothetical protein
MIYLSFFLKNKMFFFTRQTIVNHGYYKARMKISILFFEYVFDRWQWYSQSIQSFSRQSMKYFIHEIFTIKLNMINKFFGSIMRRKKQKIHLLQNNCIKCNCSMIGSLLCKCTLKQPFISLMIFDYSYI